MAEKEGSKAMVPSVPAELRPWERLVKELTGIAENNAKNGTFDIAASNIDKMMEADSLAEILAVSENGPKKTENLLNQPLRLEWVEYWPSAEKFKEGTLGVFAAIHYTLPHLPEGVNEEVFTVGSPNIVAAIRAMEVKGILDTKPVLMLRSRATANGEMLFWAEP